MINVTFFSQGLFKLFLVFLYRILWLSSGKTLLEFYFPATVTYFSTWLTTECTRLNIVEMTSDIYSFSWKCMYEVGYIYFELLPKVWKGKI